MSFYTDTQLEALRIGMGHIPGIDRSLYKLSLKELEQHPKVTVERCSFTSILDFEGKNAQECVVLDIEGAPFLVGSSPFRSGYDVIAINRETKVALRIGP